MKAIRLILEYFEVMRRIKYFYLALILFAFLYSAAYLLNAHVHPYRTFYHEILVVVAVLLTFSPLVLVPIPRFKVPYLAALIFVLAMIVLLQCSMGVAMLQSVLYPLILILMVIFAMVLGSSWVSKEKYARKICLMLSIAHLIAAFGSLLMQQVQILGYDLRPFVMYMVNDGQSVMRPYANVAQPNQLALLYCFGLASLWWMCQVGRIRGWVAWCLAAALLWGLVLTQSRIGWVILPIFAVLAVSGRVGDVRLNRLGVFCLLLMYFILVFGFPVIANWLGFVGGSIEGHVGGRSERVVLAKQALEMARTHPWLGVGWFGFGAEQVQIAADFSSTTYAEHSHNIVLNFAAELGIPFTILFFSILLFWFWNNCIRGGAAKDNTTGFACLFFVAVGIHSLVEFPLWYAYVLLPTALLMGVIAQKNGNAFSLSIPRTFSIAIPILALVGMVGVSLDYQRVVNGFLAFREAPTMESVDVEKIKRPNWTLLPDYFDYFALLRVVPKVGMSSDDIIFFERMSRRFGYVHVLSRMAEVYALNGELAKAQRSMLTLQRLHPYSYPEYFDYWHKLAGQDVRYKAVFDTMLPRDAQ